MRSVSLIIAALLTVMTTVGCGENGEDVAATAEEATPPDRQADSGSLPAEGGSISDIGGDGVFVSGGLLPGSSANGPEARSNPTVFYISANGTPLRTWDTGIDPSTHLLASKVRSSGDGWVVGGTLCEVLTSAESPGGCAGGVPAMWRLMADGSTRPVPQSEQFTEFSLDGSAAAGILTLLAADERTATVVVQSDSFTDVETPVAAAYSVALDDGTAAPVQVPATFLAPGQLCAKPDGDLAFAEPVIDRTGLSYSGFTVHAGSVGEGGVSWQERGSFEIEQSNDTNPFVTCSASQVVVELSSRSELYVATPDGELLGHHRDEQGQIAGTTQLDDALYISSRRTEPGTTSHLIVVSRIDENGNVNEAGQHTVQGTYVPDPLDIDGALFDGGLLLAPVGESGQRPALIRL